MKTTFADLWHSSSLIQGTMALAATGAIVYLGLTQQPVPDILVYLVSTVVGFYFGTKNRLK